MPLFEVIMLKNYSEDAGKMAGLCRKSVPIQRFGKLLFTETKQGLFNPELDEKHIFEFCRSP